METETVQETETAETVESIEPTETAETAEKSEPQQTVESSESFESSDTSESSETVNSSDTSETAETETIEYSETSQEMESESETETETEAETGTETETADEQIEKLSEIASLINDQVAEDSALSEQQYETIVEHMESINQCCTIIIGVGISILLCVGITAGCLLAKSIFGRFR